LLLDLREFVGENLSLTPTDVNLLFENLSSFLEHFYIFVFSDITDAVAFVISHDALAADAYLVSLAEILCFFLWMFNAVMGRLFGLLHRLPICFRVNLLHQKLCLLRIQVVEYCKVFDELLDVGTEIGSAGGAGEDVAGA